MIEEVAIIFEHLKKNPGHAYVSPDRKTLYALVDENYMLIFEGDFAKMSDEDINRYVVNALK